MSGCYGSPSYGRGPLPDFGARRRRPSPQCNSAVVAHGCYMGTPADHPGMYSARSRHRNCSGSRVCHKLPKGVIGADESSASTAGHLAPNVEAIRCTSSHALAASSRWFLRCALIFLMGLPLVFTSDAMAMMYTGSAPRASAAWSRRDRGMLSISSVPSRTSSRPPGRGMAHPSWSRSAPKGASKASISALLTLCDEYSIHAMYWDGTDEGRKIASGGQGMIGVLDISQPPHGVLVCWVSNVMGVSVSALTPLCSSYRFTVHEPYAELRDGPWEHLAGQREVSFRSCSLGVCISLHIDKSSNRRVGSCRRPLDSRHGHYWA